MPIFFCYLKDFKKLPIIVELGVDYLLIEEIIIKYIAHADLNQTHEFVLK
jgi:hypothetical protein